MAQKLEHDQDATSLIQSDGLALAPISAQNKASLSRWPLLTPSSHQIRLLDIYPAANDKTIKCKRYIEDLDDPTLEYEALSYVWGNGATERVIQVNGFDELVTGNLYDALIHLRHQTNTLTIWVDALCINQENGLEKTHQVNFMSEIYRRCRRCNAWLGDFAKCQPPLAAADVQASFDMIELICRVTEDPKTKMPQSLETIEGQRIVAKTMDVLSGLSWWERIWTAQEAVLPSRSRLVWGSVSIAWEWVELVSEIFVQGKHWEIPFPFKLFEIWNCNPFYMGISTIRVLRQVQETALDRIWRLRYRQASNPLDKVYGLMGLLSHISFSRIAYCDYTLDPASLYKKVTLDLIELEHGLKPLIGRRGEQNRTRYLPTWAIDWTTWEEKSKRFEHYWCHSSVYSHFQADMSLPMQMFVSSESVLSIAGAFVDKVDIVGGPTDEKYPLECDSVRVVQAQITTWRELLKSVVVEPSHSNAWRRYPLEDSFEDLINGKFPGADVSQETECGWETDMCIGQTLLITESGYLGLGPRTLQSGDEIWILFGGRVPFALRRRDTDSGNPMTCDDFQLVGDAFIYGIMHGNDMCEKEACRRTIRLH